MVVYTDGLASSAMMSMADDRDPRSEFQRAFSALGVTHLVAPSPQAKGKIERRFGTLQKRLVALLAYEKVTDYAPAQNCWRANSPAKIAPSAAPRAIPKRRLGQGSGRTAHRPAPLSDPTLLDLHLALHLRRRVNADNQIDFLGRSWPIAPTARHNVTLIHHPQSQFWIVSQPPQPPLNSWPEILGKYSL